MEPRRGFGFLQNGQGSNNLDISGARWFLTSLMTPSTMVEMGLDLVAVVIGWQRSRMDCSKVIVSTALPCWSTHSPFFHMRWASVV
ncbi:MAG: hypothetical protein ACK55Z_06995 [bacterium]